MAEPNFLNRTLYHGDNLEFLRGMNSETVHLIATDPPFNKNRDFHTDPDSLAKGGGFTDRWKWDKDVQEEWVDGIKDDWPAVWEVIDAARAAYGDDMGAFLCWLGVRLMEMRRVLRQDGSIYLHIDHTAHAYVKCLMDGIFGAKNFRNEVIWCYKRWTNSSKQLPRVHDTILWYSKSDSWTFNPVMVDNVNPNPSQYVSAKDASGKTVTAKDKHGKPMKRQLSSKIAVGDWWQIPILSPVSKERYGYPTQKPLALYRRLIEAGSNKGDVVLDPFCGCATTPVAAEQLERRWVGMDIWDKAKDAVKERLRDEWLLTPEESGQMLFPHTVYIRTEPPIRTDDNETAAPSFKLKTLRAREPWERLKHAQMVRVLADAQKSGDGVICAGCGRVLEVEFMQLDHIMPRTDGGANHILNRVLLCGPCNRRKNNLLTYTGLLKENKKDDVAWMKDEALARIARQDARETAEWVRDEFDSEECKALIAGQG